MPYFSDLFTTNINKIIEYQEYTKLNNYNKQDKSLPKLAVRYPNRFSDSLPLGILCSFEFRYTPTYNNGRKETLISGVVFSVSTTRSHSTLHRYTMRLTEIAC